MLFAKPLSIKSIMNRNFIFLLVLCLVIGYANGQTTNQGQPQSWSIKTATSPIDYYLMPSFDLSKQKQIDAINEAAGIKTWQFGYEHNVNYGLQNSGTWTTLSNGDRIWQIEFESKDALSMNLVFDDYNLPPGATVYLYNPKTMEVRGAYTDKNNSIDRMLGTTLIKGDNVVVEYYEPKAVEDMGSLNISMVVHGYRSLGTYPQDGLMEGLNDGGACNHDVACPLGIGWEDQINSVAIIIVGGSAGCTGALINNTSNDGTPYFLTANHCGTVGLGSWVFRFNWDSPVAVCAQAGNLSQDPGGPYNEVNGSVLRANNAGSDFVLLELNNAPTGNIYYAGWDRSLIPATQATGIHHPKGDVKKICRENDPLITSTFGAADVWVVSNWDQGVTESGSSGSPLFNQNHLIVGQLYGGGAACIGTNDNGQDDNYGRFDVSWDGASASTRLRDWLDPGNIGVLTQNGYNPNGSGIALDAGVAQIKGIEEQYCDENTFTPEIVVRNYGNDSITSVNVIYNVDGMANMTYTWTGILAPNGIANIILPTVTATAGAHTFNVSTTFPNGSLDSNFVNDARNFAFFIDLGRIRIDYALVLDCFGSETTWVLSDSTTGQVLLSGGPYNDNNGTPDTLIDQLCLEPGCYRYAIYDAYGDGLDGTGSALCNRSGDYWFKDAVGNELIRMNAVNGNFGDSSVHYFCIPTIVNSNPILNTLRKFEVFPNPTNDNICINFALQKQATITLELYNTTGQLLSQIQHKKVASKRFDLDLKEYRAGMYFIKFRIGDKIYAKKVIKE